MDSERHSDALLELESHNPNDLTAWHSRAPILRRQKSMTDFTAGLKGAAQRYVPINGGLGAEQLTWLEAELTEADQIGQRCLLLSHVVLHPDASNGSTLLWDYEKCLDLIHKHKCVAAALAGHQHEGGYAEDDGVHFVTFKSPLNLGNAGSCFAALEIHDEFLLITSPAIGDVLVDEARKHGVNTSRLPLRPFQSQSCPMTA